jgi:C1A family cysteine protease
VFGFSVYESFMSPDVASTGKVPLPPRGEQLLGGHAVLAVGYDDALQSFIVRNSWGPKWGIKGYCEMPYGYLTDPQLARDFWAVYTVEPDTKASGRRRATRKKSTTRRKRTAASKR